MTQAEDRCHRIGTTSTVWAHYLVAHGTIEERLCKAIQDKQSTIRTVLDGGVEEDDLSILDMLVEELKGPGLLQ
jgi:SNF2 family DNA or RNA helicase